MSETTPEIPTDLSGSALTERKAFLHREIEQLDGILNERMRAVVLEILTKHHAEKLPILECRGSCLFLMDQKSIRDKSDLINPDTMDVIRKDLRATDCIQEVSLTTDERHGFVQTIYFDTTKLDAAVISPGKESPLEKGGIQNVIDETRKDLVE